VMSLGSLSWASLNASLGINQILPFCRQSQAMNTDEAAL